MFTLLADSFNFYSNITSKFGFRNWFSYKLQVLICVFLLEKNRQFSVWRLTSMYYNLTVVTMQLNETSKQYDPDKKIEKTLRHLLFFQQQDWKSEKIDMKLRKKETIWFSAFEHSRQIWTSSYFSRGIWSISLIWLFGRRLLGWLHICTTFPQPNDTDEQRFFWWVESFFHG